MNDTRKKADKGCDMEHVVRSNRNIKADDIPKVSLGDYLLDQLRAGIPTWGHKDYIVDVSSETSVKFRDVEKESLSVASALARKGFKKGDVLFFVTYELAQLSVVHLAVWRLGGAIRGCYQVMPPAEYVRQISETQSKMILVDADTAPLLKKTAALLPWSVEMVSVGNTTVPGITSYQEMIKDDGSAFPAKVDVDIYKDLVLIANTSGSTGTLKGVLHSHYSTVSFIHASKSVLPTSSLIHTMISNGIGTFGYNVHALCTGLTIYYTGKFQRETFFDIIMKCKPTHIMIYPFVATWFARCENELSRLREANFAKSISVSGWMLDPTTNELLNQHLPSASIRQIYASSELFLVSLTDVDESGPPARLKVCKDSAGQICFSSGNLMPLIEAKSVDPVSGVALGRGKEGEIHFRTPFIMLGYLLAGNEPNREPIDADGWYHTGDLGFFDEEGNLYIKERLVFTYKYCMQRISPNEIEAVIAEHPSVLAAGVVGLPDPRTDCVARAFVALRPGCTVTEDDIVNFVASRMPKHKQIHDGVMFLPTLPVNRGGKLDRLALKKMALEEKANAKS